MDAIDDCIIHGVFIEEHLAQSCVSQMQVKHSEDTFAITRVPLNKECHVSYAMSGMWRWFLPSGSASSPEETLEPRPPLCLDPWAFDNIDLRRNSF